MKDIPAVIHDDAMWEVMFGMARKSRCPKTKLVLLAILERLKKTSNQRSSPNEIFKDLSWRSFKPDPAKNQSWWCKSFNYKLLRNGMPYRIGGKVGILLIDLSTN